MIRHALRQHDLRRGALLMLGAALAFSGSGALVKHLSASLPNEMLVFFRSAIGLLALIPLLSRRGLQSLRTTHFGLHLLRGATGLAAMYCFFYAIAHLTLAEATLLLYSTPLFVPFIARLWLREAMPTGLWWAVGVGFLGIVLILKPGLNLLAGAAFIGLAAGIFAAVSMVNIRQLTHTEPSVRVVFYFSLICTLGSALLLPWRWQTPDAGAWIPLLGIGVLATLGQLLLTRGYSHAPAAQVGPFTYFTVVFSALLAWWLWDEWLDIASMAGTLLVIVSGAWTIRHAPKPEVAVSEVPTEPGPPVNSPRRAPAAPPARQVDP